MHERGMDHTSAGVYFGQLLGMADPLTFVLGAHGYRVSIATCRVQLVHSMHLRFPGWLVLRAQAGYL